MKNTSHKRNVMKKSKNIFLVNRDAGNWPGGDIVALLGFAKELSKQGMKVVSHFSYTFKAHESDIVIAFNINFFWTFVHLICAKLSQKHFVVFCMNCNIHDKQYQKHVVKYADGLIFFSPKEKHALERYLQERIPKNKCFYLQVGVNKRFLSKRVLEKTGVLCVGRIEKRKNQLMLIKACGDLNIPLTIVGYVADEEYFQLCSNEAHKYEKLVSFFPFTTQVQLEKLYQSHKVVANVSEFEPFGLTTREGGFSNCNIVMTENTYVKEDTPSFFWCNPKNLESITSALKLAYNAPNTNILRNYLMKKYSWEIQAKQCDNIMDTVMTHVQTKIQNIDWESFIEIMMKQHERDQTSAGEQSRLIRELHEMNINKQRAIETLRTSNQEKEEYIKKTEEMERTLKMIMSSKIYTLWKAFHSFVGGIKQRLKK